MAHKKPTKAIQEALNELLQYNDRTAGKVAGNMYLGKDIFIVTLREPRTINGEWEDIDRTMDIFDLMELYENENKYE